MNCPGCKKELPLTLSVCPSCGTMIGDSVREELASKIVPLPKTESKDLNLSKNKVELKEKIFVAHEPGGLKSKKENEISLRKPKTSEVNAKPTDPTLVEFQNKAAAVPEWRLRLQNAVRRRLEQRNMSLQNLSAKVSDSEKENSPGKGSSSETEKNVVLEKALRRIEESRSRFGHLSEARLSHVTQGRMPNLKTDALKTKAENFKTEENLKTAEEKSFKKHEVKTFPIVEKQEKPKKFDTTKLPPISEVLSQEDVLVEADEESEIICFAQDETIRESRFDEVSCEDESLEDSFEDYAPFFHRFGAGLFDLVVGVFLSFILLLPFIILGKNFFSAEAIFAFLTTIAIVMFVYLTTCVAFFGQTLGMKIFSLEIIDVEENDYPTLHQAAINTIVYLLSLLTCGLGFLPALFNRERRTMHDLVAGTIVVKELN